MTDAELLRMATAFEVKLGEHEYFPVMVEACHQREGSDLWAIRQRGFCLNKQGEWEYEPLPSSRDEAFFARCRWADRDEAIRVAQECEP